MFHAYALVALTAPLQELNTALRLSFSHHTQHMKIAMQARMSAGHR